MPRRVAITGVGLVSCLGHDYEPVLESLREGRSGIRAVPEWEGKGLKSLVAGMIDNIAEKKEAAKLSKNQQYVGKTR